MSEQRGVTPSDIHRAQLDDLIKTYTTVSETTDEGNPGQKKKGKLKTISKTARKTFVNAWVALVEAGGLNEETMGLMCNGFRIAQAEPLYRYVEKTKDDGIYKKTEMLSCIRSGKEGIGLKVYMNLLACELLNPSIESSPSTVAGCLNRLSLGKRLQIRENLNNCLLNPLKAGISADAKMPAGDAQQLRDSLSKALTETKSAPKTRAARTTPSKLQQAAAPLLEWLTSQIEGVPAAILAQDPVGVATKENVNAGSVTHADDESTSNEQSVSGAITESNTDELADRKDTVTESSPGIDSADARPVGNSAIPESIMTHDDTAEGISFGTSDDGSTTPNREASAELPKSSATTTSNSSPGINDIPSMLDVIGYLQTYEQELVKRGGRIRDLERSVSTLTRLINEGNHNLQTINDRYDELAKRHEALEHKYSAAREQYALLRNELDEKERMLKDFNAEADHRLGSILTGLGTDLHHDYENYRYVTLENYQDADEKDKQEAYELLCMVTEQVFKTLIKYGVKLTEE